MRKLIVLFIILLLLSLMGCNRKESNSETVIKQTLNEKTQIVSSKIGEDIGSFIPKGWYILKKVEGDLNKDNINDIVVVIERMSKSESEASPRALLIAFRNKDNTYTFSVKAEHAILKADEGGVWGDPFEEISINRGSILISFYGGSNSRWYGTYRFRYQDHDWYLIGATVGSSHTSTNEYTEETDYNLLTGEYIKKKADKKGIMKTTKGTIGKRSLLKLKYFVANQGEEQYLNKK